MDGAMVGLDDGGLKEECWTKGQTKEQLLNMENGQGSIARVKVS